MQTGPDKSCCYVFTENPTCYLEVSNSYEPIRYLATFDVFLSVPGPWIKELWKVKILALTYITNKNQRCGRFSSLCGCRKRWSRDPLLRLENQKAKWKKTSCFSQLFQASLHGFQTNEVGDNCYLELKCSGLAHLLISMFLCLSFIKMSMLGSDVLWLEKLLVSATYQYLMKWKLIDDN